MTYTISYEKNGVFQAIGVNAQTAEQATAYFGQYKPAARFIGICEGMENKPGFPVITVPDDFQTATEETTVKSGNHRKENENMKKYADILADISAARAGIVDTAKAERELARQEMLAARKTGTDAEFAADKAAYMAAEEKYISECMHNEDLKMTLEILKDNAAQAFFSESIGTICDIWNKYTGKPHGEKTADKIRNELFSALGVRVWVGNKYDNAWITCYFQSGNNAPFNSIEFSSIRANGERIPALIGNKIQRITPEMFRVYCCGGYVDNPDKQVLAIREAHTKAVEAEKALQAAISEYNDLTRGSIARASVREGIKNWYI